MVNFLAEVYTWGISGAQVRVVGMGADPSGVMGPRGSNLR